MGLSDRHLAVHIDELVLDGVSPRDHGFAASLAERLAPAFGGGVPASVVEQVSASVRQALTEQAPGATRSEHGL